MHNECDNPQTSILNIMRHLILLLALPLLCCGQPQKIAEQTDIEKIYADAITQYINAVKKEQTLVFDTLYFGKHPDFPNITLPSKIENTSIIQINFDEGMKKQKADSSLVYINLVGWVEKTKAEFIFVTFWNSCSHQFDYFLNYKISDNDFVIDNSRFEYFLYKKK